MVDFSTVVRLPVLPSNVTKLARSVDHCLSWAVEAQIKQGEASPASDFQVLQRPVVAFANDLHMQPLLGISDGRQR